MAVIDETGDDIGESIGSANMAGLCFLVMKANVLAFSGFALDVQGVTYYYWPNTSGVLRYGTTKPTIATQDTAGAAV